MRLHLYRIDSLDDMSLNKETKTNRDFKKEVQQM